MSDDQPKNPLHGITLKTIVEDLVARRGFPDLAHHINIRCFAFDPSIKSSLKFLRKNDWARAKVEQLYLNDQRDADRRRLRNKKRAERRAHAQQEATPDEVASRAGENDDGDEA